MENQNQPLTSTPVTNISNDKWELKGLLSRALDRTKDRFLNYIFAIILYFLGILGFVLVVAIIGGGLGFLTYQLNNNILFVAVVAVLTVIAVVAISYLACWASLTFVQVIINDTRIGVIDAYKKVRPLVWGFLGVQFGLTLFFVGLLPFIALSLGVVGILWSFWAAFLGFIYLETNKKGMQSLWNSRALINQKFWTVAGRMFVVNFVFVAIYFLLMSVENEVLSFIVGILSWVYTPFIISYNYELYKNLDKTEDVKAPQGWIITAIIGWILLVVLGFALVKAAAEMIPKLMNNPQFQKEFQKQMMPSGYPSKYPMNEEDMMKSVDEMEEGNYQM